MEKNGYSWESHFGVLDKLKKYYGEPYRKAIAPWVASAIDLAATSEPKILVVGGGNGHFTRELLPAVIQILKRIHGPTKLHVVETDVDPHIHNFVPDAIALDVLDLTQAFPKGSFHVIVGESMIHQLGNKIPYALDQINQILIPGGAFIHVQDAAPDPRFWLSRETKKTGILEVLNHAERRISKPEDITADLMHLRDHVTKETHERLNKVLTLSAKSVGLNIGTLSVTGSHDQNEHRNPHPLGIEGNHHLYLFGTQHYQHEPKLPQGIRRLEYAGALSIMSQRPMSDFERHYTSKNFEYRH